jgi:hypothetical protein
MRDRTMASKAMMSGNGVFRMFTALLVPGFGLKNFTGHDQISLADPFVSYWYTPKNDHPKMEPGFGSVGDIDQSE